MNIVSDLFTKKPDVIGFSCYIWNIEETIRVIQMLKKIMPELTIILGDQRLHTIQFTGYNGYPRLISL